MIEDHPEKDLVPIFETTDRTELMIVKSLLEAEDIPCMVQGAEALGLLPLGPFGSGIFQHGVGATIYVLPEDEERAREVLKNFPEEEEN